MIRHYALALLVLALSAATGGVALAADPGQLPETVSRIERETGGRVLSAQKSQRGGREVNRIKVLTPEGRVRVMWDDPQRTRADAARRGERSARPMTETARPSGARDDRFAERDER